MASKIRVLNEKTINQIAAGEVIESPASVVKELVENALDAGARQIVVRCEAGGRRLITVSDDGCGMSSEDAVLSVERHATSKIRSVEDVEGVQTLGFRGEALSAISSVARVRVETAEEGVPGVEVGIDGGKLLYCRPSARARGTTVSVRDLFYNVPVRQKFLRAVSQDVGEIHRMGVRLALASPQIGFSLQTDSKWLFRTGVSEDDFLKALRARVMEVLGDSLSASMVEVDCSLGALRVRGLLGEPELSRPSRLGQYLFLNERAVGSRLLSDCVRAAYGTRLTEGRHPLFVLHVALPGPYVDVNVHPQKREVRLREEKELQEMMYEAVQRAFCRPVEVRPLQPRESSLPLREWTQPLIKPPTVALSERSIPVPLKLLAVFGRFLLVEGGSLPEHLVKEGEDALVLVDMRSALKRLFYERVCKGSGVSQGLLVPISLELMPKERALLLDHLEALHKAGFGVREFGGQSFVVDAVPPELSGRDVEQLILELLGSMEKVGEGLALRGDRERRVAFAAGRVATPKALTAAQGLELLRELLSCEEPRTCPSGAQIFAVCTEERLQKLF